MKPVIPRVARHAYNEWKSIPTYYEDQDQKWKKRSDPEKKNALAYWEGRDGYDRCVIADVLTELILRENLQSVLEYGAYAGTNLRNLRDRVPRVKMLAVEPNREAYEFIDEHLGLEFLLKGDHDDFLKAVLPPVDISFTSAVFYSMRPEAVDKVLGKMAKISRYVVLFENVSRAFEKKSKVGLFFNRQKGDYFAIGMHDYALMAENKGLKLKRHFDFPKPEQSHPTSGCLIFEKV